LQRGKLLLKILIKLEYHYLSQHTSKTDQCLAQIGDLRAGLPSLLQAMEVSIQQDPHPINRPLVLA